MCIRSGQHITYNSNRAYNAPLAKLLFIIPMGGGTSVTRPLVNFQSFLLKVYRKILIEQDTNPMMFSVEWIKNKKERERERERDRDRNSFKIFMLTLSDHRCFCKQCI